MPISEAEFERRHGSTAMAVRVSGRSTRTRDEGRLSGAADPPARLSPREFQLTRPLSRPRTVKCGLLLARYQILCTLTRLRDVKTSMVALPEALGVQYLGSAACIYPASSRACHLDCEGPRHSSSRTQRVAPSGDTSGRMAQHRGEVVRRSPFGTTRTAGIYVARSVRLDWF